MSKLSEADDHFHVPATTQPWWTETCWFSFDLPEHDLSLTVYPFFRPNLGICSLAVYLWDASAHEPWAVRYARSYWHLPMPRSDLVNLDLEGLGYERLEPLHRYRVTYEDADVLAFELEYTGLRAPHEAGIADGLGHFDQPCRVVGELRLRGETLAVDGLGMRDRTWSERREDRRGRGSGYTYGHVSADEQFLVMTNVEGNQGSFRTGVFTGYLVRDGVYAPLTDAARRVVERVHGYPVRIELEATDALGRRLEASGTTRNRLADQATSSQFAWMSMTEWHVAGGGVMYGEDQEVWSPDRLGRELTALDT